MSKTQSMILTLYGDYIRHYGSQIWIGSLIQLLKPFGYNEQAVRVQVSRMMKQGLLQSERKGNKSYYELTERGISRVDEAARRIYKLDPHEWDGKWRVVMYNIPEEKRQVRDDFRKELQWSGFGNLSSGCWVSPNNFEKEIHLLVSKYKIEEYVHLFLSQHIGPQPDSQLVEKCWHLDEIGEKYEEFIDKYSKNYIVHQSVIQSGEMTDEECFIERANLVHVYRKFLFIDPFLPKELLPERWIGNHAALLFNQYYKVLSEPASRYFEAIFQEEHDLGMKDKDYNAEESSIISYQDRTP
ncbi:phenylacetic acid degradation operon negative regulatory protein PaaX [Niallia endozanthoxylica]|uniref:Phenylacetic acid degradation operon negative regulatory protein PaaX n=1 Tax=Niallia endozanthoxylica TaxID=2036016 RepID=A0A5J5H9P4_9BACI|nr:phenylacetic acid degradation operon negative regulatory protein PaaX [Niallia endozanthoxylica]KAA9017017.1 phenylacetic acid degradation operon negative regulatory protein PaaX [Niallia endozanthoxylica]